MNSYEIKISRDFSYTPGPRSIEDGEHSGEKFRDEILADKMKDAISKGEKLIVNLDNTAGYAPSFHEEAFGGLIRKYNIDYKDIKKTLIIISNDIPFWIERIEKYLKEARDEKNKK